MTQEKQQGGNPGATRDWILIVDDDEPILTVITSAMASDTLDVVTAIDARTGLQALDSRANEPLAVVTDVMMPGMDGLTLARKLIGRLTRSKIIVMSGHLSDASWWPTDLREIAFLTKPFRMAELAELVELARADFRAGA